MKFLFFLSILIITFNTNSQLTFVKSDVVKGCFSPVIPPHEEPFLISSENGLHLIKNGTKALTQVDFDQNLKFIEKRSFKLKKEYDLKEVFSLDNKVYLVGRDERFQFIFMEHNLLTGVPIKKCVVKVDNQERLKLSSIDKIDFEGEGVAFKLVYGEGAEKVTKLLMMNKTLEKSLWTIKLDRPTTPKHEYMRIRDIQIRDTNKYIIYYNHTDYRTELISTITQFYIVEEGVNKQLWNKEIKRNDKVSVIESDPVPFILDGVLDYHTLSWDIATKTFYLNYYNEDGEELDSYVVSDDSKALDGLVAGSIHLYRVKRDLFNDEFEYDFNVEQRSKREFLSSIIEFKFSDNEVEDVYAGGSGFPLIVDEILISEYDLAYKEEEEIFTENPKEVFDRYGKTSSFIKNFLIDDQIYSLFSIYLTGNMTSQIVRWKFN